MKKDTHEGTLLRYKRAKDLSVKLAEWQKANKGKFPTLRSIADAVGFDDYSSWGSVTSGKTILTRPDKLWIYAAVYVLTGIEESDPRTLPAHYHTVRNSPPKELSIAWTESKFNAWLDANVELLGRATSSQPAVITTAEGLKAKARISSPIPQEEVPVFGNIKSLGGLVDALVGLTRRTQIDESNQAPPPKVTPQLTGEVSPASIEKIIDGVVSSLTPHINAAINGLQPALMEVLLPKVTEAVWAQMPVPAFDTETIKGILGEELDSFVQSISAILRKEEARSRSVTARGTENPGQYLKQLIKAMDQVVKGSREDRDAFVVQVRPDLARAYQLLSVLTLSPDDRERNLPTTDLEVKV